MGIYHPQYMPDGSVIEIDSEIVDRLHNGDSAKGWEGDPNLVLTWHRGEGRFELWRLEDDGEYRMVMRGRPGMRILDGGIIDFLVAHDTRRGYNPYADAVRHNLAREAHAAEQRDGAIAEVADKLHWALKKDIGHHEGGSRHRLFTVPDWKK